MGRLARTRPRVVDSQQGTGKLADILNTGISALLSTQRAISVTGNNIANVNTEGFARQRVLFASRQGTDTGVGSVGSGVTIAAIERSYDRFLAGELLDRTTSDARANSFSLLAERVDALTGDSTSGVAPALVNFFAAVQDMANKPGAIPERRVVISRGEELASSIGFIDTQLSELAEEVNGRVIGAANTINGLAADIATINNRIVAAATPRDSTSSDLQDSRDRLITELATLVDVTVVDRSDGAVNISIGNGQPLVVGDVAGELVTFSDNADPTRVTVGLASLAVPQDLGRLIRGGELGALLAFRSEVFDGARSQLGVIAAGLSQAVNEQQGLGLDLDGNLGGAFFDIGEPVTAPARDNAGTGSVAASITDAGLLTGDRYRLGFDGADYTLTNVRTGASQTGAGPTLGFEGISVSVSGTPAAGDSFDIAPVANAASTLRVALSDPRGIAAAGPLTSQAALANLGTGALQNLEVTDIAGIPLAAPVTLSFNADALGPGVPGFDVTGIAGGPIAYDPATDSDGVDVSLGGFAFRLQGRPEDGDSFLIRNNTDGTGDNRNGLALAALQQEPLLSNGTLSFRGAYGSLVSDVAVRTAQARNTARTESALLDQARSAVASVQGVNLDEEAANLLRYQQAYQAAAQFITVSDTLFQSLIGAVGR